jgi:hypothetical protein
MDVNRATKPVVADALRSGPKLAAPMWLPEAKMSVPSVFHDHVCADPTAHCPEKLRPADRVSRALDHRDELPSARELASMLAPHLRRPREARKLVANLLSAPGSVAVTDVAVHIRLAPAATPAEQRAIQHLCTAINERRLTLPGDPKRLPLRFNLHLQ